MSKVTVPGIDAEHMREEGTEKVMLSIKIPKWLRRKIRMAACEEDKNIGDWAREVLTKAVRQ